MNNNSSFLKYIILSSVFALLLPLKAAGYSDNDAFYFDNGLARHKFHVAKKFKMQRVGSGNRIFKDDNYGVNFMFGKRFDSIGIESGYTVLGTQDYKTSYYYMNNQVNESLKHENSNFYVDLNNYFRLMSKLELKTALGLGVLQTKTTHRFTTLHDKKLAPIGKNADAEVKPRVGAGLQYNFNKDWSANLDLRYQGGNKFYRNMKATSLNFTYRI